MSQACSLRCSLSLCSCIHFISSFPLTHSFTRSVSPPSARSSSLPSHHLVSTSQLPLPAFSPSLTTSLPLSLLLSLSPSLTTSLPDCWSALMPTLTRADAHISSLYFLGATEKLLVIGGNNTETVVTSFCVDSQCWGRVQSMERTALIGQGTVLDGEAFVWSLRHGAVMRLNLDSLSFSLLPTLPLPSCYESLFHLCF